MAYLRFDNGYSWMTPKQLSYTVEVIQVCIAVLIIIMLICTIVIVIKLIILMLIVMLIHHHYIH